MTRALYCNSSPKIISVCSSSLVPQGIGHAVQVEVENGGNYADSDFPRA